MTCFHFDKLFLAVVTWDWAPTVPEAPYLPLSRDLLMVAVWRVTRYLACPEGDADHSVGAPYHQERQKVDQDGHAEVIPRKSDRCWVCPLPILFFFLQTNLGSGVSQEQREFGTIPADKLTADLEVRENSLISSQSPPSLHYWLLACWHPPEMG